MNNYMKMANMIPELQDWVETGILAPTKLDALISANFQRSKNSEAKQRKVADEYVRLCGYKNGGNRKAQAQNGHVFTLDEIAKQLGTSKTNLKRVLTIERNLTDSMKELLDTGEIIEFLISILLFMEYMLYFSLWQRKGERI